MILCNMYSLDMSVGSFEHFHYIMFVDWAEGWVGRDPHLICGVMIEMWCDVVRNVPGWCGEKLCKVMRCDERRGDVVVWCGDRFGVMWWGVVWCGVIWWDVAWCGGGEFPQLGSVSTINFLWPFSEAGLLHVCAKTMCPLEFGSSGVHGLNFSSLITYEHHDSLP